MFNRSAFNDVRFNQPVEELILSAVLSGSAGLKAHTTASMTGGAELSANAGLAATISRNYDAKVYISATSSMHSKFLLMRALQAHLSAQSSIIVNESKYQVRRLGFTGGVPPGGTIIIDAGKMELTLNGDNAIHFMTGDFSILSVGINEVVYTDQGTQRTISMQVLFKDVNI